MNILLWITFGALAGLIASMISGANARMGALANIVVGIFGALIGGWIMSAVWGPGVTGLNLPSLIVATVGAVVLLFLVGLVRRENTNNLTKSSQEIQSSVSPKIQQKRETQSPPMPSASKSVSPKI